jgi:2-succinyl-5-enolpyruvyl-6-hydroxy-3-cyclohexene-1-carboxylate synthase
VLVDEWQRAGVTDAVACPGSRSTPLLVALAECAERGALRLHVLLDERAAGFFALGLALATGRPAPVVTTSGTAAAELHPAVLEAHHANVPLLVVTADRPPEAHDVGAPQTVRQVGLYGEATRWEANPGVPELASAGSWRSIASRSVAEAAGGASRPGPVHLNLAFREPLVGSAEAVLGQAGDGAPRTVTAGRAEGAPWHRRRPPQELAAPAEVVELLAGAGERGLIVAGAGSGSPQALWGLSMATGWPVLADPLSGARLPGAIGAADALLRTAAVRDWEPELVLRLGRPWASRVLVEWLASLDCPQVLVDRWGIWAAPDRAPAEVVVADPAALCAEAAIRAEAKLPRPGQSWAGRWARAEMAAQEAIDAALAGPALSEPGIARALVASLPVGATLLASSSMPVRDVEWWARPREGISVVSNRGANGIDGVLSTALGVASASDGDRVVVLLGDLAFLYDAGALAAPASRSVDLTVVVVDNNGGGIFGFLPQATSQPRDRFERLWGTPHGTDALAVARGYGAAVRELTDLPSLRDAIGAASEHGAGLRVLVARTDRHANVAVHERLVSAVAEAVEVALRT